MNTIVDDNNFDGHVGTTKSTRKLLADYTPEEIETIKKTILSLPHAEMISLRTYGLQTHPFFDPTLPFLEVFNKHFDDI